VFNITFTVKQKQVSKEKIVQILNENVQSDYI